MARHTILSQARGPAMRCMRPTCAFSLSSRKRTKVIPSRHSLSTLKKIGGNSKSACNLFDGGMVHDYSHSMKMTLSPGQPLDEMDLSTGGGVVTQMKELVGTTHGKRILLLDWARHIVVQASSNGVFGTNYRFQDINVEKAFWRWQKYLPSHMAGTDFLDRAGKAREVVYNSMLKYCSALPPDVSKAIPERQRILKDGGMSHEDAAEQETMFTVGVFGNTAPTLFWSIYELFSRPSLLAEGRQEIATHAVTTATNGDNLPQHTLDVAALKTECPLLLATYRETQRVHDSHANIREVLADTFLADGRYLLRKGNYCLIPSSTVHRDTSVWGETAASFDPYRFTTKNSSKYGQGKSKPGVPTASSFLAWGTPPRLCPTRQFAATEILIILTLLVMQVDLVPTGNGGEWEKNPAVVIGDLSSVLHPKHDVEIDVKPKETAAGEWALKMGESMTRIALASG